MIENILNLLRSDDFYACDELIDIAKGKYQFTLSLKKKKEQNKRRKAWR